MEFERIRHLLKKYYDGRTSVEEENELRNYFDSNADIPPEFEDEKLFFTSISDYGQKGIPDFDIDEFLNQTIDSQGTRRGKGRKLVFWSLRIAAGIILLVGSMYFIDLYLGENSGDAIVYEDTFKDNPQLAYEETMRTLMFVSQKLNTGQKELQNLSKFNQGIENLQRIGSFDKVTEKIKDGRSN